MPGIFISYRREDSGPHAARLRDALITHFGHKRVFFDLDSISLGRDFREAIRQAGASCEVLLAIIGNKWANVRDSSGRLRLENPGDYVRIEISFALQNQLHVIPILVDGAPMPQASSLPVDIRDLAYRQALDVSERHFKQDIQLLVDSLIKKIGGVPPGSSPPPRPPRPTTSRFSDTPEPEPPPSHRFADPPGYTPTPTRAPLRVTSLFPIYGITPGKTTVAELAKKGNRTKTINSDTRKPYLCYELNGVDFWYNEKSSIVESIHLTHAHPFPQPWQEIGFRWENSYVRWLALLKDMGYAIGVQKQPCVEPYDGRDSFSAKVTGRKMMPWSHEIELDFRYGKGTSTSSAGSLYSMRIALNR